MYEALYKTLFELRPLVVADVAIQWHAANVLTSAGSKIDSQNITFEDIPGDDSRIIKDKVYIFFLRMFAFKHIAVKGCWRFQEQANNQMPCDSVALREHFEQLSEHIILFSERYANYFFPSEEILKTFNYLLDGLNGEAVGDDFLATFYEAYNHVDHENDSADGTVGAHAMSTITSVYTPLWLCKLLVKNAMNGLEVEIVRLPSAEARHTLESFRILDPTCGCGNFLFAAYDRLYAIYASLDYDQGEIPAFILQNVYGFDIEDKVVQLTRLGLFLKAKQQSPECDCSRMNVFSAAYFIDNEKAIIAFSTAGLKNEKKYFGALLKSFEQASTIGTLLQLSNEDVGAAKSIAAVARDTINPIIPVHVNNMMGFVTLLSTSYNLILCNPPYALPFHYSEGLKNYIDTYYNCEYDFGGNLYSCFIKRAGMLIKDNGLIVMVHPAPLFYAKKFAGVRTYLLQHFNFEWLLSSSSRVVFQGHIPDFEIVLYALQKTVVRNKMFFLRIKKSQANDARMVIDRFINSVSIGHAIKLRRNNTKLILFYMRHPNLYDRILIYFR